jgi:hypothetical protein
MAVVYVNPERLKSLYASMTGISGLIEFLQEAGNTVIVADDPEGPKEVVISEEGDDVELIAIAPYGATT